MIYIAHRGNIDGPNPELENNPDYINSAIALGYDVEIDLRFEKNELYLGHDKPQYIISKEFLQDRKQFLWVHCKDYEALDVALSLGLHCFWHDTDDYTMTSWGYTWAYPEKPVVGSKCVFLTDNKVEFKDYDCAKAFGICSDYVKKYKSKEL